MSLKPADIDLVQKGEHFAALLAHEGFKQLLDAAKGEVATLWRGLRTCAPEELRYTQGRIDGMNFFLEYANAAVSAANLAREAERADQAAAVRAGIEHERARLARSQRDGRAYATVST